MTDEREVEVGLDDTVSSCHHPECFHMARLLRFAVEQRALPVPCEHGTRVDLRAACHDYLKAYPLLAGELLFLLTKRAHEEALAGRDMLAAEDEDEWWKRGEQPPYEPS